MIRSFTREELYDMIWSRPLSTVAAELGKSDVALNRMCRRHAIPTPPQGWWTRKAHGKEGARTSLSPRDNAPPIVMHLGPGPAAPDVAAAIRKARSDALEAARPFPRDPVVARLVACLKRNKPSPSGRVRTGHPSASSINIGRSSLDRVTLLLDGLAVAIGPHGFVFRIEKNRLVARHKRQSVIIRISEGLVRERRPLPASEQAMIAQWERRQRRRFGAGWREQPIYDRPMIPLLHEVPNGRFRVEIEHGKARYHRRNLELLNRLSCAFADDETAKVEAMRDAMAAAIVAIAAASPTPDNSLFQRRRR